MKTCDGCGQQTLDEFAWVIEGDGNYFDGKYADSRAFSPKIGDAVRFARKQDAETVRHWIFQNYAFALRVTQHGWSNGEHR